MSVSPASEPIAAVPWKGIGLVLAVSLLLGLAALPPFVPDAWRPVLMDAFAGACHQLPARSPHIDGVALAVCDRCAGLYLGVALGGGLALLVTKRLPRVALLGSLVLLGLDWMGPLAGLWMNTPWSRALTGLLAGLAAGWFVLERLLPQRHAPKHDPRPSSWWWR